MARERLLRDLVAVRSVWFPTPVELRQWRETEAPLYATWGRHGRVDLGPRTESIYAARFCPVLRARLREEPDGSAVVEGRARFTNSTLVVVTAWWLVVIVWGAVEVPAVISGVEHAALLGFWGFLALTTLGMTTVGWMAGRRLLADRTAWLVEVLTDTARERQDW